ncbi:MAG: hypothetical protein ACPGKS_08390, partial [Coraliomargarita sp.]
TARLPVKDVVAAISSWVKLVSEGLGGAACKNFFCADFSVARVFHGLKISVRCINSNCVHAKKEKEG